MELFGVAMAQWVIDIRWMFKEEKNIEWLMDCTYAEKRFSGLLSTQSTFTFRVTFTSSVAHSLRFIHRWKGLRCKVPISINYHLSHAAGDATRANLGPKYLS